MFDIGWSELLVIAVVAIVVIGPKDLPRALRTVGQWTGKMKRMAREFQSQFNEAMREAELDDVKKEVEPISARSIRWPTCAKDLAKIDASIRTELNKPAAPPSAPVEPVSRRRSGGRRSRRSACRPAVQPEPAAAAG